MMTHGYNHIMPMNEKEAMKILRKRILFGQKAKTLQLEPGGEGMAVVEW